MSLHFIVLKRSTTNLSERHEDLALLARLGFLESLLAVVALGDGVIRDEPARLGGVGAGGLTDLTTVPLAGKLALLADAGAARWHLIFLGGNGGNEQSANDKELKRVLAAIS